ncbi:MAG: TldD/PmbA family protein [Archaeoglobaceae archaeon]|nr:TldD/PmbA family protein [Archaeoglobaceae archaeon]
MEWEVYEAKTYQTFAEIERNKLKKVGSLFDKGYAARVIINGKLGFAVAENEEKALELAKKIAKFSEEKLDSFPFEEPEKVSGIYDKKFESIGIDFLKEEAETLISSASKVLAQASVIHSLMEVRIRNSNGVDLYEKSTLSSVTVEVAEKGSGYSFFESRKLDLNLEEAVKKAEELEKISSKTKRIEEKKRYDIILSTQALHQLFSATLYPSFSAENVAKGRSKLKIGEYLGEIKVIDDGTLDGGIASCNFDDEGCRSRRKILVDKEVLNFISDWKNSKDFGVTGNGFKDDLSSYPTPKPSNVILDVRRKSSTDDAIYVHYFIGSHTANPVSGDFSYETHHATLNDEPVKVMVYGNVFELLKNLDGYVGKVEQFENTVSAPIRFKNVNIV